MPKSLTISTDSFQRKENKSEMAREGSMSAVGTDIGGHNFWGRDHKGRGSPCSLTLDDGSQLDKGHTQEKKYSDKQIVACESEREAGCCYHH